MTCLSITDLICPGIMVNDKFSVNNGRPEWHLWISMVRKEEAVEVSVLVVPVDLQGIH